MFYFFQILNEIIRFHQLPFYFVWNQEFIFILFLLIILFCGKQINELIYMFLLGETLVLDDLQFNTGKPRQLLLKSSGSNAPYTVFLVDYLTSTIPVVSRSLELLFD